MPGFPPPFLYFPPALLKIRLFPNLRLSAFHLRRTVITCAILHISKLKFKDRAKAQAVPTHLLIPG